MNRRLRRDAGFAAVSLLALAAPLLGRATALPFLAVAGAAAFLVDDGPLYELFARPRDRQAGRLYGLASFALAAAVLAFLAAPPVAATYTMPLPAFAASVVTVGVGNLGATAVRDRFDEQFLVVAAFAIAAFLAALLAQLIVVALASTPFAAAGVGLGFAAAPTFTFHAAMAALIGALTRSMLSPGDTAAVTFAVGASMLVVGALVPAVHVLDVALALGVALFLGGFTYATGTASGEGMLAGVVFSLVTIGFGGPGWFVILLTFFGIGSLSTKFRYEEKADRGVAEANEGARGLGNVLGNAGIALAAVVGFAAVGAGEFPIDPNLFRLAFAGSLATATGDTLSSEIGGLFDTPRLVTTGERVPPGTDGAVTWQGELAGLVGAALVGVLAVLLLGVTRSPATVVALVTVGGFAGMTADSLLGATVEGDRLENETVNLLATLAGALASVLVAFVV